MLKLMNVGDLIDELQQFDREAPLLIAVVKDPSNLFTEETPERWIDSQTIEAVPIMIEDVHNIDGIVYIMAELEDLEEQEHLLTTELGDSSD